MANAECRVVIADAQLLAFLTPEPTDPPMVTLDELRAAVATRGADAYSRPADDPDSLAILQFTSGSTADAEGRDAPAPVRHREHRRDRRARCELDYDLDRAVSWLPLYHDMGLIGMLMIPMTTGTELVLAGPQDFLAAPARWAQWISDFHAQHHRGPELLVRAVRPRDAPRRRPGPEPVAGRAERRRADRAELGRGLAGRRRAARPAGRHRVLRLRHGRVDGRHHVPGAGQGHDRRLGRRPGARDRRLRRRRSTPPRPAPAGCRSSGRPSRASSCASSTRAPGSRCATARPASSRCAARP